MDAEFCLREKNIKVTNSRIWILNIIDGFNGVFSADNIFDRCKEKSINIDLSTIYRNLDLFEEKGIVDKFDLGHGKYNYKIKIDAHQHLLECSICHKEVIIDCPMTQVEELIKNKTGFILTDHELKVKAICGECVNKEKK
ncbi:MAG: transcriptional repressor [Bacillota bacterium]|nr:transcriptional repressor [Bacillota bacterium]